MADYYSILKKTIASLPENNGAARRSVYSRARNAIVNQLKAYEPPLAPSEITAEQLRLEEAIRKVEAEAARQSLGLGAPAAPRVEPPAPQTTAPVVSQPAPAAGEAVAAPVQEPPAPGVHAPEPQAPEAEQTPVATPLQEVVSEAEGLGTAAAQAAQNAREAAEPHHEEPAAQPARQEPQFDSPAPADDGLFEPEADAPHTGETVAAPEDKRGAGGKKTSRGKRSRPSASDALRSDGATSRIVPIAAAAVLALLVAGGGAWFLLAPSDPSENTRVATTSTPAPSEPAAPQTPEPAVPEAASPESDTSKNTDRLLNESDEGDDVVAPDARAVTTTTITPQADEPEPAQPAIVSAGAEPAPATAGQPPVAVPQDNLAAISPEETTPAPAASSETGAQRSILYEEGEDAGGAGTAAQGAVSWSLDQEANLDGQLQAVLSAAVEIPERDVTVEIRIKPNDDTSLPASHLVEIKYDFPDGFAAGDVVNVPGLVMKPTEEARGDALIGASVKVSPGFFWIALSSLPNEQQRNLALLRERGWIDIPMLYENGKRGILTLEKGAEGTEAVEKAVTAWQAG